VPSRRKLPSTAANLSRLAVDTAPVFARVLIDIPAEFGCDLHLIAHAAKRFADHDLIGPRTVSFGRVEEVHAKIDGLPEQRDHFGPVRNIARFPVAHRAER
jgi:hypothetical protein